MNSILDAMKTRRSIRKYKPEAKERKPGRVAWAG